MSPLNRLGWQRAVAGDRRLHGSAYRVALFVGEAYDARAESFRYSTEAISREINAPRSSVQAGLYQLAELGWLVVSGKPSKGRAATAYRLARPDEPTDQQSGRFQDTPTDRPTDQRSGRLMLQPTDQPTDEPTGRPGTIRKIKKIRKTAVAVGPMFTDRTGKPWQLKPGSYSRLVDAFPSVDVAATLANVAAYCAKNPQWRRAASNMWQAIWQWFLRERDSAAGRRSTGELCPLDAPPVELPQDAQDQIDSIEAALPKDEAGNPLPVGGLEGIA